jgi:hypothetical protein
MKFRALIALLFGAALAVVAGGSMSVAAATTVNVAPHAYPPSICSTLAVSSTNPNLGESITVTGENFEPNGSITLVLTPRKSASSFVAGSSITLKTVTSDASGAFSTTVTMPSSTANAGHYVLTATTGATRSSTCPADPVIALSLGLNGTTTGSGTTSGGGTAFTGLDVLGLGIVAALLVGVGALFVYRGRRVS